MPENLVTWLTQRIARYSYGIYLVHYLALWLGFVVCRSLNVGLQTAIFVAVLVPLPVILYHTVEAPLMAAGVKISGELKLSSHVGSIKGHSAERGAQTCSGQIA